MTEVAPAEIVDSEGHINPAYESEADKDFSDVDLQDRTTAKPINSTSNSSNGHAANGKASNGKDHSTNGHATSYNDNILSSPPAYDDAVRSPVKGVAAVPISAAPEGGEKGKKKGFLSCLPCFNKDKEDKPKPKMVGNMALFRFADKWDVILMVLGVCFALAHGVAMPILLVVFGKMTDNFVSNGVNVTALTMMNQTNELLLGDDFLREVQKNCIYFVADGICVIFVAYGQVACWLMTSYRQSNRIRHELLRCVLRQDVGWFDTNDAGELGSRLSDDVNKIQQGIGDKVAAFIQWMSTFVVGLIIGLSLGWKLALVIIAVSPAIAICGGVMMHMLTLSSERESMAYAKAGSIAEEVLSSMRTVVAFGGQEKECIRYNKNLVKAKEFGIRKAMVSGGGMGMTYLVLFLTYALAFWYGGLLIRTDPHYTVGTMLIVFFCVVFGAMALGNAAPNLQNIATARGAAYTIWTIIDRVPVIDSSSNAGICPSSLTGDITVKDVHFTYPSRPDIQILKGLTLEINRGQTVALVGSSGCGKSTLIQLLQRFYNPHNGSVCIDGTDIKDLNIKWLRRHIGVVSQEPVLFATTIGENIRYGREGVTQEELEMATKEANAYDFINKLPLKFDTMVGERGAQLSGGQKQRIAIARALVRDPKILLLDEATSALDTESEATVQAALDKARQGRTTIVVAHRLSTIRTADVIYGIKNGVVHEFGTHNELMQKEGIYYKLVMNQQVLEEEDESGVSDAESEEDMVGGKLKRTTSRGSRGSRKSLRRGMSLVDPEMLVKKAVEEPPEVPLTRVMAMNKQEWYVIIIGCIMAIIHGGTQPVFGLIFGSILGVFVKPLQEQIDGIFFYSMMFIVLGGAIGISMFVQGWMFGISGEALTLRLRTMAFKSLLRQEIAYFDDPDNPTGALTTRLATDASAVQGATGYRLGMMLQGMASLAVGVIIGFIFSWKFALFILGVMPFILLAAIVQMQLAKGFSGKNNEALEDAGKVATEAITNIRTIASLSKEETFLNEYMRLTEPPFKENMRTLHITAFTFCMLQSMIFFAYAAIFYFGAWLVVHDGLNYEDMFKVFISIIFGAISIGRDSAFGPDYGKAKVAAARIFALFDKNPGTVDSYSSTGEKPATCMGTVEFRDVQFSYPTRSSVQVLKGLNLSVAQGHTIALVGSSGCGKSTTVQLLQRFYDTAQGQVCLDGKDVTTLNVAWLRAQMGLVSQEPVLFDYSLRENIAYGDNTRDVTMEEVIEAARKANIHNFIQTLPEGYETSVGDKGTQLSGGQKQRVAIARALLRNPKILLLDEATSALDTESEKIVQEALDRAQEGRTCLVIAHRLSTIQNASQIVVFHTGRVAEQGTHSELMASKGLYYKLNVAQGNRK